MLYTPNPLMDNSSKFKFNDDFPDHLEKETSLNDIFDLSESILI